MVLRDRITIAAVLAVLVAVSITSPRGQGSTQSITNEAIINLVSSGVPESTILYTIEHAPTNFDLSSLAIEYMKHKGVSDKVIQAMQKKAGAGGVASPAPAASPAAGRLASAANSAPAATSAPTARAAPSAPPATGGGSAKVTEYPAENGIFYKYGDKWARRDMVQSGGGGVNLNPFSLTGQKEVWAYPEAHAKLEVSEAKPIFYINKMGDQVYGWTIGSCRLYRMTVKKNYRELPYDFEGLLSGGGPRIVVKKKYEVEIELKPIGEVGPVPSEAATFIVSPKSPLEPGEYLLSSDQAAAGAGSGAAGVDFSVISKK